MGDGANDVVDALRTVRQAEALSRRAGRWAAWTWVMVGTATAGFLMFAPPIATGAWMRVVTFGFAAVWVVLFAYTRRQSVQSRTAARLAWPVTALFCLLVLATSAYRIVAGPTTLTGWLVLLAALTAVPGFYGAWRVWCA